jgi:alcohol dehydrogenase (cytochrome c)
LLHANRNGFFYVLDRTDGELLRGAPFVEKLTWASGIGDDGRPILVPGKRPTPAGNIVCPGMAGATNWLSPAYNPKLGVYYVQATEYCQIFTKREERWEQGKQFFGGAAKNVPGEDKQRYLRAIDVSTGKLRWELYEGDGGWRTWGGVLSTAGGVVFFGDDSGAFAAVKDDSGKPLWSFHLNANWRASPMTYLAGGRQFVAIGATRSVVAFALPQVD